MEVGNRDKSGRSLGIGVYKSITAYLSWIFAYTG